MQNKSNQKGRFFFGDLVCHASNTDRTGMIVAEGDSIFPNRPLKRYKVFWFDESEEQLVLNFYLIRLSELNCKE